MTRLIAFRNDRLGARLTAIVNAIRIGTAHGIPWAAHWHQCPGVGRPFNDPLHLFAPDWAARHLIDRAAWRRERDGARRLPDLAPGGAAALRAALAEGRAVAVEQAFGVAVLAGEDGAEVRRQFAAAFRTIAFAPDLAAAMAAVASRVADATAYHVRRGDVTSATKAKH